MTSLSDQKLYRNVLLGSNFLLRQYFTKWRTCWSSRWQISFTLNAEFTPLNSYGHMVWTAQLTMSLFISDAIDITKKPRFPYYQLFIYMPKPNTMFRSRRSIEQDHKMQEEFKGVWKQLKYKYIYGQPCVCVKKLHNLQPKMSETKQFSDSFNITGSYLSIIRIYIALSKQYNAR